MAQTLYPPEHVLSIGEVLDLSFRIFRVSLLKCLPLAVAALLLAQLPNIYSVLHGGTLTGVLMGAHDSVWWALYVVGWLLSTALWGAVLVRQHAVVSGQGGTAMDAIGVGLRRLAGMIAIFVIIVLAIGVCMVPAGLLMGNRLAMGLAILVLLLPASYVMVRLSCASTAYLINRWGIFESVQRSWTLTEGAFWRLAAIYTVALFVLFVFYFVAAAVAGAVAVPLGFGDVAIVTAVTTSIVVILGAFATPFFTAVALAVFGDLSARREGADLAARISGPATP
jgi:hypothetical protein